MRLNDLGPERVDRAKTDVRADPRERREPLRIIGPVKPVGPEVRIAGPVVEMGRVDREQVETCRLAAENPRRSAEQIVVGVRRLRVGELGHHRRVAGDERSDLDVFAGERGGQCADDIGEPPGLDEREDLRGDRENFQLRSLRQFVDHRLGDQRDAALGAAEALGVKLGVLADHEAVGNMHFAVDDGFGKPHVAPDRDVRKHDRLMHRGVRMDAHAR